MLPLLDELRARGSDNSVRAVVLTGAGTGFCSGADQEAAASVHRRSLREAGHFPRSVAV